MEALEAEGLALARGDRVLFTDVAFRVARGEALALTGRNGAGKTSLLRAVAGFIRPLAGTVRFFGPAGETPPEDARARDIHLLGHLDGLKPGRTAGDELAFQVRWTGGARDAAEAAARRLGIAGLLELEVRKLSAGQRRRLALARLVGARRPLWLLDEPLAPLDSAQRAAFGAIMSEHLAAGGLIIAAVHDPLPVAARPFEIAA